MAMKPRAVDLQLREQRQRSYVSSVTVSTKFPRVAAVALELRFTTGADKLLVSPYSQIYTADMQAFFELQCPSRDCSRGGFDLQAAVQSAVSSRDKWGQGRLQCNGTAVGGEGRGAPCPVELSFEIAITPEDGLR